MGKVKTIKHNGDELKFEYDIKVNTQGEFYINVPKNIIELFEIEKIDLEYDPRSRQNKRLSDVTFDGVKEKMDKAVREYESSEMIDEKIVIRYAISTTCSYCKEEDGTIKPNGTMVKSFKDNECQWCEGTEAQHAANPQPYGLQMYAKPYVRRDYKYKSGRETTKYTSLCQDFDHKLGTSGLSEARIGRTAKENNYFLNFLDEFVAMRIPGGGWHSSEAKLQEVEYTEKVAEFFVNMLVAICKMSDQIKDFLEPESIKKLAESGIKLLGQ